MSTRLFCFVLQLAFFAYSVAFFGSALLLVYLAQQKAPSTANYLFLIGGVPGFFGLAGVLWKILRGSCCCVRRTGQSLLGNQGDV